MSRLSGPSAVTSTPSDRSVSLLLGKLREFFAARGGDAYLVGGVVRDLLAGREISDIDITVVDPVDVASDLASTVGGRVVPLDDDRDIVRVVVPSGKSPSFVDVSRMRGGIEQNRRDELIERPVHDGSDVPALDALARQALGIFQ
ncbi:MAG: hypothetical protein IH956_06260, partial [Chloroflexi bacterium]|nr:hypothetical protein [Chloroflexota bacterium]